MEKRIVIIGAGHAGLSCAEALRAKGFKGTLTVVDKQLGFPAERPPLSKGAIVHGCNENYTTPLLKAENWFIENKVDLVTGTQVASINRDARKIYISNENSISYTTLVIATGATPIELPVTKKHPKSFTLRTLMDAQEISKAALSCNSALIIGGGYIGLEVAASLTDLGLKVTVVETEERPLAKIASRAVAERLVELHQTKGVSFKFSNAIVDIDRFKNKFYAKFQNGESEVAEMIVTGVGVRPDSLLGTSSSLAHNENDKSSLVVDENCVTCDRHILAIGDVARRAGTERRIESVNNAQEDGKQAAAYIMKEVTNPRSVPWFWSEQYDKTLQIAGIVPISDAYLERVVRPGKRDDGFSIWSFVDNDLKSVEAFSDPASFAIGKKFLAEGLSPSAATVVDLSIELKNVFKDKKNEENAKKIKLA